MKKKLTPWFSHKNPVRSGVYQVKREDPANDSLVFLPWESLYAYFDASKGVWSVTAYTASRAAELSRVTSFVQNRIWRGLAENTNSK